jgi:hypothetical protein
VTLTLLSLSAPPTVCIQTDGKQTFLGKCGDDEPLVRLPTRSPRDGSSSVERGAVRNWDGLRSLWQQCVLLTKRCGSESEDNASLSMLLYRALRLLEFNTANAPALVTSTCSPLKIYSPTIYLPLSAAVFQHPQEH